MFPSTAAMIWKSAVTRLVKWTVILFAVLLTVMYPLPMAGVWLVVWALGVGRRKAIAERQARPAAERVQIHDRTDALRRRFEDIVGPPRAEHEPGDSPPPLPSDAHR